MYCCAADCYCCAHTAVLDAWSCSCCDNAQPPTSSSHRKLAVGPLRLCFTRGKLPRQTDLWAQKKTNTYRFDAIAVRFHVEPGQSWASVFMPIWHKFGFYAGYGRTKGNRHKILKKLCSLEKTGIKSIWHKINGIKSGPLLILHNC